MPRFYFDINEVTDRVGMILQNEAAAFLEAKTILPTLSGSNPIQSGECKGWTCVVRDEAGTRLLRVTLAVFVEDLTVPSNAKTFTPV